MFLGTFLGTFSGTFPAAAAAVPPLDQRRTNAILQAAIQAGRPPFQHTDTDSDTDWDTDMDYPDYSQSLPSELQAAIQAGKPPKWRNRVPAELVRHAMVHHH